MKSKRTLSTETLAYNKRMRPDASKSGPADAGRYKASRFPDRLWEEN